MKWLCSPWHTPIKVPYRYLVTCIMGTPNFCPQALSSLSLSAQWWSYNKSTNTAFDETVSLYLSWLDNSLRASCTLYTVPGILHSGQQPQPTHTDGALSGWNMGIPPSLAPKWLAFPQESVWRLNLDSWH